MPRFGRFRAGLRVTRLSPVRGQWEVAGDRFDGVVLALPAGPAAEQLFRNFELMSASDQETISNFAKMLADKSRTSGQED